MDVDEDDNGDEDEDQGEYSMPVRREELAIRERRVKKK